jgi:hypothetical protein
MATTIRKLTAAELLSELNELLSMATEYAALESRIESKVLELERSDWAFSDDAPRRFTNAVSGELKGVFDAARGESSENALDLCERIQDAREILELAIERSSDAR